MESLTRPDQLLLAIVVGIVGFMVLLALRSTKPGAPARMGAIVAGLMLLLTLIVGLHAREVTSPRSKEAPGAAPSAATPLRPRVAEAVDGSELTGDPQDGLTIAATSDATVRSAYLPDARICDGRVDADVQVAEPGTDAALVNAAASPRALVGTGAPAPTSPAAAGVAEPDYGAVLTVRAGRDPASTDGLSIAYLPGSRQARLTSAGATTLVPLTAAAGSDAHLRIELSGQKARVWMGSQLVTASPVPTTGGCAAVRFGTWGAPATLRALTIQPS